LGSKKEKMKKGPAKKFCMLGTLVAAVLLVTGCPSETDRQAEPGPVSFPNYDNASSNTKRLMNYLNDEYGKHIISGQMDTSWTTNATMDMVQRVYDDTGKYPALKGFDFIQLPWDNGQEQINEAIQWWQNPQAGYPSAPAGKHGIVAFCWHWKVGGNDFYTENTAFRIPYANGALNTSSANFALIKSDLDKVAVQLQKLEDLDIPVLWRPLHEASGGWFWWGASGPAPYIALWEYIYDYLSNVKGLSNLIWVWNGQSAAWFPNPATVDIVGNDLYPGAKNYGSQKNEFVKTMNMVPGKNRIVALTENGAIPDPDNLTKDNAWWSFFMTWNDGGPAGTDSNNFWSGEYHNSLVHKKKVYNHSYVITLDELPDLTAY
jgi:mannan endo-1,4-beta-mannosidase